MRCAVPVLLLTLSAAPAFAQGGSPWELPAEGGCVPSGGLRSRPGAPPEDVATLPFATGHTLDV